MAMDHHLKGEAVVIIPAFQSVASMTGCVTSLWKIIIET